MIRAMARLHTRQKPARVRVNMMQSASGLYSPRAS
jgi:hypothetical protein